jgi:hypothetical protein
MKAINCTVIVLAVSAMLTAGTAEASVAALQGRDIHGNPVAANDPSAVFEYDPNLNITWLRDWSYRATQAQGSTHMTWSEAQTWVTSLTVGSFSGWTLPTTAIGDASCSQFSYSGLSFGGNCVGSQMGYLYYTVLGNAWTPYTEYEPDGSNAPTFGPFQNVQNGYYLSATRHGAGTYAFDPGQGFQSLLPDPDPSLPFWAITSGMVVAVRAGDVATAVPEPSRWLLSLLGLGAVIAIRRRHRG